MSNWHKIDIWLMVSESEKDIFEASFHNLYQQISISHWRASALRKKDGHTHVVVEGPHDETALEIVKTWCKDAPLLEPTLFQ